MQKPNENVKKEVAQQVLASEMILKNKDKDGYDLDLTRFNIDERVEIKTEYFDKMSTFLRPNNLS